MNAELQDRIAQLPPLPQAVLALQATLQDESASVADCALRIRQDPALTARLLRLANSAFYGVPGRVGGIDDAFGDGDVFLKWIVRGINHH